MAAAADSPRLLLRQVLLAWPVVAAMKQLRQQRMVEAAAANPRSPAAALPGLPRRSAPHVDIAADRNIINSQSYEP